MGMKKKVKVYCDRCNQEIKGSFDEHLHGFTYLMTSMPGVYIGDYLKKKND